MKRKKEFDKRRTGAGDERDHESGDELPATYIENQQPTLYLRTCCPKDCKLQVKEKGKMSD